jgi:hypothetical protein
MQYATKTSLDERMANLLGEVEARLAKRAEEAEMHLAHHIGFVAETLAENVNSAGEERARETDRRAEERHALLRGDYDALVRAIAEEDVAVKTRRAREQLEDEARHSRERAAWEEQVAGLKNTVRTLQQQIGGLAESIDELKRKVTSDTTQPAHTGTKIIPAIPRKTTPRPAPKPTPRPASRESRYTPLSKPAGSPTFRPSGILQPPAPRKTLSTSLSTKEKNKAVALPSTVPDSQESQQSVFRELPAEVRMEGLVHEVEGLNASRYALHPERRAQVQAIEAIQDPAAGPRRQGSDGERAEASIPTRQGTAGERGDRLHPTGQGVAVEREGLPEGGWTEVRNKKKASYAAAAGSPPPTLNTPLAGHAQTTTANSFWVQWIIPKVDNGKVTAEEVKRELRKNKATKFLEPKASQFQFANRALLSDRIKGGWYVSFQIPRGPGGEQARQAFHTLRADGFQIFGAVVKPRKAPRASAGTLCTVCCQYGHGAWRCFGRPPRCTLCAGPHWWADHRCTTAECETETSLLCQTHESVKCAKCGEEHAAGSSQCKKRPSGRNMARGAGQRLPAPPSFLW